MSSSNNKIKLTFRLSRKPDSREVTYLAASPPDYRSSFSGSALPFANAAQAFDRTPNKGKALIDDSGKSVHLELYPPNSYYVGLGTLLIPPTVQVFYTSDGAKVSDSAQVGNPVPFRSLTYPGFVANVRSRKDAMFYDVDLPVIRSQESILRSSAYPDKNEMPANFWGSRPPV